MKRSHPARPVASQEKSKIIYDELQPQAGQRRAVRLCHFLQGEVHAGQSLGILPFPFTVLVMMIGQGAVLSFFVWVKMAQYFRIMGRGNPES